MVYLSYDFSKEPSLLTVFSATASSSSPKAIVSFRVIAETRCIVIITCGGDITTISLGDSEPIVRLLISLRNRI